MTISHNNQPADLIYEHRESITEDEEKLDQVDLRKVKSEVRYQEPHIEKEQFILLGMSPKESLVNEIKVMITDFQKKLRTFVNDTWDLMETDPEENSIDYSNLQSVLTDLISTTERAKRNMGLLDRLKRRRNF